MNEDDGSLRDRVTRQGEEALGRVAQELLDNRLVVSAVTTAFEARERALRAQEVAMGALNLPSAADLERLTRRVRSVSQRLEGIEDGLDRLDDRLERPPAGLGSAGPGDTSALEQQLARIEATLARLEAERSAPAVAPAAAASPAPSARDSSRKPAAKQTRKPAAKRKNPSRASGTRTRGKAGGGSS